LTDHQLFSAFFIKCFSITFKYSVNNEPIKDMADWRCSDADDGRIL